MLFSSQFMYEKIYFIYQILPYLNLLCFSYIVFPKVNTYQNTVWSHYVWQVYQYANDTRHFATLVWQQWYLKGKYYFNVKLSTFDKGSFKSFELVFWGIVWFDILFKGIDIMLAYYFVMEAKWFEPLETELTCGFVFNWHNIPLCFYFVWVTIFYCTFMVLNYYMLQPLPA